jgi:hypothetical protein
MLLGLPITWNFPDFPTAGPHALSNIWDIARPGSVTEAKKAQHPIGLSFPERSPAGSQAIRLRQRLTFRVNPLKMINGRPISDCVGDSPKGCQEAESRLCEGRGKGEGGSAEMVWLRCEYRRRRAHRFPKPKTQGADSESKPTKPRRFRGIIPSPPD